MSINPEQIETEPVISAGSDDDVGTPANDVLAEIVEDTRDGEAVQGHTVRTGSVG